MLGLPGCGVEKPCPFHDFWAAFKDNLHVELTQVSLGELAVKTVRDRLRLTLI
jgi:hypothetical protein